MNALESQNIQCPYCGETIEVLIDNSEPEQAYIEDCQVCCRPIEFRLAMEDSGETVLTIFHENE